MTKTTTDFFAVLRGEASWTEAEAAELAAAQEAAAARVAAAAAAERKPTGWVTHPVSGVSVPKDTLGRLWKPAVPYRKDGEE